MRRFLIGLTGLVALALAACEGARIAQDDGWRPPTREECRAAQFPTFGCPGQTSGP